MTFSGKILLVDDEAHIRKFVGLIIKKICPANIIEAPDGLTALGLYEREQPDLVLLDINMPILDGIQTLERLRQFSPDANVVMLTSLANRRTVEDCERLGALAYIRKDTPRDELGANLLQIIEELFAPDAAPAPLPSQP